ERKALPGAIAVLLLLLATITSITVFVRGARVEDPARMVGGIVLILITIVLWAGLMAVQPNQARVLTLFGKYKGSVKTDGLWWVIPLIIMKAVSLRVRNFETAKLNVNDLDSNPIEIGAVVVWQVVDSAEALF